MRQSSRLVGVFVAFHVLAAGALAQSGGDFCQTFERWKLKSLADPGRGAREAQSACFLEGNCDNPLVRDTFIPDGSTPIRTIRLQFHAFAEDTGQNPTAVEAEVKAQVSQLNADFAPARVQFTYRLRTINSTQFRYYEGSEDFGLKSAYAVDPAEQLNVYIVVTSGFSFGTFPWDPDATTFRGGIVLHQGHFGPGRSVLTHEVGHCVGLWHTHHGVSEVGQCSGCYESPGGNGDVTGDFASDTAPTPTNYTCTDPAGNDGCSGLPWAPTNPENYMGYAPDSCQTSFSPQQMGRTHCWYEGVLTGWTCDNVAGSRCCGDGTCDTGEDSFSCPEDCGPPCVSCSLDPECDDGLWCNGAETCGGDDCCAPGIDPCPGQACIEGTQTCVDCLVDADCDDGLWCNGLETCSGQTCFAGTAPCPGELCDDNLDSCVDCLSDAGCDDGVFCNGLEQCIAGLCNDVVESCPGKLCDEEQEECLGTVAVQPRSGMPLLGLTPDQSGRFEAGRVEFSQSLIEATGLGPAYNEASCAACHASPTGGFGQRPVTRFGFYDDVAASFDPLENLGGTLLQDTGLSAICMETMPAQANVVEQRLPLVLFGAGLVEAIADADIEVTANNPPPGVSGQAHMVEPLESPGTLGVGRFGWKAQHATLLSMTAQESLDHLGLTNRLLPTEHAPNGDSVLLDQCDSQQDPEDVSDDEGNDFIGRVSDYQRFLAPPPQTPRSGMTGATFFGLSGCPNCHKPLYTTQDSPFFPDVLRNQVLTPYSDFLLHDMGDSGEYIEQEGAARAEVRTPALWGLVTRDALWHDGRISGGTFQDRVLAAIDEHNVTGSEGQSSAQSFLGLPSSLRDSVVAFLASLGRAEFDHDGDHDVDSDDHAAFQACFTGPGSFYTPNDACAISDVDQDGDVDNDDFTSFLVAAEGASGGVPNGADAPGQPLTAERGAGDEITLSWGASCLVDDVDYEVYEGTLGDFASHAPVACGTTGSTSLTFESAGAALYYLVVPSNGFREGSYGVDSTGVPRARGNGACLPQAVGACQ